MKKILFTLSVLLITVSCKTQNKNRVDSFQLPENTIKLTINPQRYIPQLPDQLAENSGLIFFDNLLWTFNDSGGKNIIFALNVSGEIEKEIVISNATNIDWEEIAQDKKFIYIGDFGNNNGVRSNQKIYRIKKKDIKNEASQSLEASEIGFAYKDQEEFKFEPLGTRFDCEAMVEFNGSLYIFTKNWVEQTTIVYEIPKKKGVFEAEPVEQFEVNGLITGADISQDKNQLALVGYKDYKPFVWIFSDISKEKFFQGPKIYMELDEIFDAQTEGICFKGNDSLLISCEQTTTFNQQVFLIDLKSIQ